MRYLLVLLLLAGCKAEEVVEAPPEITQRTVAIIPCPKQGNIGRWPIDDPREALVIQMFLQDGDLEAFERGMQAINPAFGDSAREYQRVCFTGS